MQALKDDYARLESAAENLKNLSYAELVRLAELQRSSVDWQTQEIEFDGEKVRILTNINKIGRLRKRVGVELTLDAEGEAGRVRSPFIYFERFESGRLYPSPGADERESILVTSLRLVFLGGVVIALLAILWYLFLRDG